MSDTVEMLKKMVDLCSARHSVLAHNIANADTQGYRRQDVKFSDALSSAVKSGDIGRVKSLNPEVATDEAAKVGENGNSVRREQEVVSMTKNKLLYDVSIQLLSKKYSGMRKAIRGQ